MSAFGPKRTWALALHMSAFGGKADIAFSGITLSWSLLGVKRTSLFAAHMSAFDPKRTLAVFLNADDRARPRAYARALQLNAVFFCNPPPSISAVAEQKQQSTRDGHRSA